MTITHNDKPHLVSDEIAKKFLEIENQKLTLEQKKIEFASQRQKDNIDLAKISLSAQKEVYLKDKIQKRYDILLWTSVILAGTTLFFVSAKYLLENSHKDLLMRIVEFLIYVFSIYFAYRLGKKKGKDSSDDAFEEIRP